MKKRFILMALLVTMVASSAIAVEPGTAPKREQRGMWMTAYLSDWPSGNITASNTPIMQNACRKMLDTMRVNHINVIYYHVRAMCDAMYNSAYEPWSSYVTGTRGVAPAFDPFGFLIEEAHQRGIEVYAWVNPYRYGHGANMWGQSELDYIHTHPEWLLTTSYETVLNPGIPEVRQRVVDVCKDILVKYDVDGLVFDDYFYNQDNPSFDLDADLYNAYRAGGGTMSQGDWRRENVNMMVRDVNNMVKTTKPWVRFGIGPAGVACSSQAVADQYGVEPSPGSDWQYNQIYSDPMAWVTRGTIDFLAPQVYWNTSGTFIPITTWWGKQAARFNRHVYISQWVPDETGWTLDEFVKQGRVMRQAMASGGNPGMVYFRYSTWRNKSEKIDGKVRQLRIWLRDSLYSNIALNPAPAWLKPDQTYTTVTSLACSDGVLSWDSIPNVRYVIYTIPDGVEDKDFHCQAQYIDAVSYNASYTLPADKREGYRYAVTILDRWENEYAPAMPGRESSQAMQPQLISPADGADVMPFTQLQWTAGDASSYVIQIYADGLMDSLVTQLEVDAAQCELYRIPSLPAGTYWWRVVARGINRWDNASELRHFTLGQMHITSPVDAATAVPLTPVISWTPGGDGTSYLLELSSSSSMNNPDTIRLNEPQWAVPQYRLAGASTYYARVTASYQGTTLVTPVTSFTTVEVTPAVPVVLVPGVDGMVLGSSDVVRFEPVAGAHSLRVQISSSETFPTRASYNATLEHVFDTQPLGTIKGVGKLNDGTTYYVRARYAYRTLATGTSLLYTDYCPVASFVYREALAGDVNGDGAVNISDVNSLISIILNIGQADDVRGDVNGDGTVNISDVNVIIGMILR